MKKKIIFHKGVEMIINKIINFAVSFDFNNLSKVKKQVIIGDFPINSKYKLDAVTNIAIPPLINIYKTIFLEGFNINPKGFNIIFFKWNIVKLDNNQSKI